uniref:Sperm associated antigen 5 n=1 Tax=Mastacembelus armatus TaxID=205130 RepID=A0A3Q3MPT7_9TELE
MSARRSSSSGEGLPSSRYGERTPLRSVENEILHLQTPSFSLKSELPQNAGVKTTKDDAALCDSEPQLHSPSFSRFIKANASMDDMTLTTQTDCGLEDVTFKSFTCAGGEVEISGSSVCAEESNVLPKEQAAGNACETEDTVTSDSMIVQSYSEHIEHPYYNLEVNNASLADVDAACFGITSNTSLVFGYQNDECVTQDSLETDGSEKPANGLSNITFKSFNCIGGEIEISEEPKPADETVRLLANHIMTSNVGSGCDLEPSILAGDHTVQNCSGHLDHPYCNIENYSSTPNRDLSTAPEQSTYSTETMDTVNRKSLVVPDSQTGEQDGVTFGPFSIARGEIEKINADQVPTNTSSLPEDQTVMCQSLNNTVPTSNIQEDIQDDYQQPNSVGNEVVVPSAFSVSSLTNASLKSLENKSANCEVQDTSEHLVHSEGSALPLGTHKTESSDCSQVVATVGTPTIVKAEQHLEHVSQVCFVSGPPESSEESDSAFGPSGNGPVLCNSSEKTCTETLTDVLKMLSECPSVASALPFRIVTPVVKRVSLSASKACKDFFADDSAFEGEKSLVSPLNLDPAGLWGENIGSPMPCPLFNSTALDGPLQQQLLQMAQFLILASGKMGPAGVVVPAARATPPESHSVCVGTAVKLVDHSINTSGQFERKRDFSVVDSCTLTDPLLWNVPPGSLERLPRQELEQRLRSSMIMVEALVQQLAAARAHGCPSAAPAPSDLREALVQTDHTELTQTTMYRDLYMEALTRISELELDESSLHSLIQCMHNLRVTMTNMSNEKDATLSNLKKIGDVVREDHQCLLSHYGQMNSLIEKTKVTHARMMQKVKDALHQRNEMKTQMEEAFSAKEAAFSVVEQLRMHCDREISELEECVGSQEKLLDALNQAYPEQVALNQACTETLNSASDLLSHTMEAQSSLMKELCTVRGLLHKTAPMLLKMNEKTAAALREKDEHISAKKQAIEKREQMEEELNQANLDLQIAREQISDLNLQVTILTTEMGVLREKLTNKEEDRSQLERKVTELSATVSSTLASYTFLEQAFNAETTKLQQSWKDIQHAKNRANELEMSLDQSEQRVCELSEALAQKEEQLSQLQSLSQSQKMQIRQLQDICTQLNGVREMNEFLQMESDLMRENMAESESTLRANLQGLRERNIECEDLKGKLSQLQCENQSLHEQLESTRSRASATQLELGEKLAQAVTEITLLHHTLRGLTNELHKALDDQKPEPSNDKDSHLAGSLERWHPSTSFVDSIMVALTAEKEEVVKTDTPSAPDTPEPQCDSLFSEMSAFTRVTAITPKKHLQALEFEPEGDEQSSVAELLADLGSTVTELGSTLKRLQQQKDIQLEELNNTIYGLQREQQAAERRHEAEVLELKHQLRHLNSLVEKGNQALQQKTQDEKVVTKLVAEIQAVQEILNKHRTDNNELRKEVVELRRSLQEAKVESQFLHEELRKAGGQSANPANVMEEKIKLLKEVERLKVNLQEVEQARVKLLERAKRHQMIHQSNQQKSENELHMLNNMINKVRETLLSLPEVMKNCEQIQHLIEYIG